MSNPNASFYQLPKTGTFSYQPFAVGADYKLPDYFSSVFKPTQAQTQAKGTNTTTGGRDQPAFDYQSAGGAVPGFPSAAQQWIDFYTATSPTRQQERIQEALINQQITQQQLASTYPFLSQAAEEAAARNYGYSARWEDLKQQLPSNLQNIAASQQAQASAAASGEAGMINALANLQNAQRRMNYRGSTFAVG
jgi:hypothetical protein